MVQATSMPEPELSELDTYLAGLSVLVRSPVTDMLVRWPDLSNVDRARALVELVAEGRRLERERLLEQSARLPHAEGNPIRRFLREAKL
jgi:hypothetical protein